LRAPGHDLDAIAYAARPISNAAHFENEASASQVDSQPSRQVGADDDAA
jgi:hypothetical protein